MTPQSAPGEPLRRLMIRDIEAAARAAALSELRRAVEGLHRPGRSDINYRAVLALIDTALGDGPRVTETPDEYMVREGWKYMGSASDDV